MKIFPAVVLISLTPAVAAAAWLAAEEMTAQELLDSAARVYSSCASYRDRGTVESVFVKETGSGTVTKPFATAFVRPGRFRFEYRSRFCVEPSNCYEEEWQRYIVSAHGNEVQSWWDRVGQVQTSASLSAALAAAKGISSGSSYAIPALLMPDEIAGFKLSDLESAQRLDDDVLGETECVRIEGWDPRGRAYTIWLDKETLWIRQIFTVHEIPGATVETTTTYEPELDVEIAADELRFEVVSAKVP